MQDFSTSRYQQKKVAANKTKVTRKPLNLRKYVRPLVRICGGIAGACLVVAVLYLGYRMSAGINCFRLTTIEVSDTRRMSREEVLAMAGIETGRDLLRLNLKLIGEQIVRNPWVESVSIRRYYPDTLNIRITEREPVAVINMGYLYYLDTKGNVFKVLNQGDRLDFPVVTGFSEEVLNNDPAGTKAALQSTCELLKILREKGAFILADVSEIHYDRGYGFTMFTSHGALPVKIGSGDFTAKLERFARIYRELMAQRPALQYIDLDYIDKIIVKKG